MVSRKTLSKITPPKRSTPVDVIELMCERYWDAFRAGYCAVGGRPEEYPTWKHSTDPVKEETRRCMRHAVEALAGTVVEPDALASFFPNPPKARSLREIRNDAQMAISHKLAEMDR